MLVPQGRSALVKDESVDTTNRAAIAITTSFRGCVIDRAVQSQLCDASVTRIPFPCGIGAAKQPIKCVNRGLPEI